MSPDRPVLLALLIATAAVPAHAGAVRGVVRVPVLAERAEADPPAYPGRASAMPMAHEPERGRVTDAVLYLERIEPAADSALAAGADRPVLAQEGQAFVPRVIAVPVGGCVDFPNRDPIYHNVFSLSPARRFDLGRYPRGQSRTVCFPKAGLVNVYCEIHSNMEAFILVVPNHAFTRPAQDGSFALEGVPPGHYVLHAWHPDLREVVKPVDVPESGDARLEVAF